MHSISLKGRSNLKSILQLKRDAINAELEVKVFEIVSQQIEVSKQPDLEKVRFVLRRQLAKWRKELARAKAALKGKR